MNSEQRTAGSRLKAVNDLTGKNAVITGGSSGIGAAAALMFAELGARVAVGYHRRQEAAQSLVGRLPGSGHCAVQLALEDIASVESMARNVSEKFDKIDILVNSAGFTRRIPHRD